VVGLPDDNLTILGLARRLGERTEKEPLPTGNGQKAWADELRRDLGRVVRGKRVAMERAWAVYGTRQHGLETRSYRFDFSSGLSAAGVWLEAMERPQAPGDMTIVLHDEGKAAAAATVSERVNRGEPVLALDLIFTGDAALGKGAERTIQAFAGLGDRPLGMRATQLLSAARWARATSGAERIRIEATGVRSQVVALVAAALEPEAFSEIAVRDGIPSLRHALDVPLMHPDAPELFCFGLYPRFDLDRLEALAGIPVYTRPAAN
jgi:hypothetical protein